MEPVPTTLKATVVLRTGQKLRVNVSPEFKVPASSLTEESTWRFTSQTQSDYFVSGGNIAYIEV